jgi:synaptic vesicle membrane protein VAT-1
MPVSYQDIVIDKYGPANNLRLRDQTAPALGDDEVAIDVAYSGINFADIQMRLGFYPDAPKRPFVPGYEVSGRVAEVGKKVTGFAPGDEVVAGTYFGGYASRVHVAAHQAFKLPGNVDLAAGAAVPVAFFTAHIALFEMARVREGDKVLIECATGGVGTLAIQMARHAGAEVVGLTTTPAKKGYIEELGATAYTRDEFYASDRISGFDMILQASGGAEIKKQLPRLGITGRMVCLGMNSGVQDGKRNILRMLTAVVRTPRVSVLKMFDSNTGIYALNALHVLRDPVWVERLTSRLADVERMGLTPHVGQVYPAAEVARAHEALQTKQARGKLLLSWN